MRKYDLKQFKKVKSYEVSYIDYDNKVKPESLLRIRKKHKLTQVRLANILNVNKNVVDDWEKGKNSINGSTAVLIYLLDNNPKLIDFLIKEQNISKANNTTFESFENKNLFNDSNLTEEQKEMVEECDRVAYIIFRLAKRRIDLKMSVDYLSKKSGIDKRIIERIEALDIIPRLDVLVKLAMALGIELSIDEI